MRYYCNPVNVNYRYQFCRNMDGSIGVAREAADPTMIQFRGKYYIFASMTLGYWVSEDMANWREGRLPEELPLYDYAPDARVLGEYVYFSASRNLSNCDFWRTKDIENGPYERIAGSFPFWDPNLFIDGDGQVYFYWGCSNSKPIYGVELDAGTMQPLTEKKALISGDAFHKGFERIGDDHAISPRSDEEAEEVFRQTLAAQNMTEADLEPHIIPLYKSYLTNRPYIEGAWMDKFNGKYYLQYACPGTEYNGYGDAVYVGEHPLGPFELAENVPYSYMPGGFFTGAGHGSTMRDGEGILWHAATMRISKNMNFERRVGIWPAGIDESGNLFCNQRYGDWPVCVEDVRKDPFAAPRWMLLSYGKAVRASSAEDGKEPEYAVDEDVRTWWRAASGQPGEWLELDLGEAYAVHAIQINFADDKMDVELPGRIREEEEEKRYIEERELFTRWKLEGSADGTEYFTVEDKSGAVCCLPHDLIVREAGVRVRFLRLTIFELPYGQAPCISGFRVFGAAAGEKPSVPQYTVKRISALDAMVSVEAQDCMGLNILWGSAPDKLYHSYLVYGKTEQKIGALVEGREYYFRVDAFNENGITEGRVSEKI